MGTTKGLPARVISFVGQPLITGTAALTAAWIHDGLSAWVLVASLQLVVVLPFILVKVVRGRQGLWIPLTVAAGITSALLAGTFTFGLTCIGFAVGLSLLRMARRRVNASGHVALATYGVAVLAVSAGPIFLVGGLAPILVGWSRVSLRQHTLHEVILGVAVGAATGSLLYATLTFGTLI